MKRALTMALLTCLLAGAALPASAGGWIGLLKNTPAEVYDDEDLHMFLNAARQSLNADLPPQEIAWKNEATGSGGRFLELSRSMTSDGRQCKRTRFWTYAKQRSEKTAVFSACKDVEGRWRLGTAQTAPKK